jgi:hypothetical protein
LGAKEMFSLRKIMFDSAAVPYKVAFLHKISLLHYTVDNLLTNCMEQSPSKGAYSKISQSINALRFMEPDGSLQLTTSPYP